MEHYQATLREKPDQALAHYNVGYLHEERGAVDLALEHYRRALASDPDLSYASERLRALNALPAA